MNQDVAAANEAESDPLFEWLLSLAACAILFGPLVAISFYYAYAEHVELNAAAETVGIGVILRAMIRRILRSGARGAMQTAVGTVTRASSRTVTRRVVRVGVKSVTSLFGRPPLQPVDEVVHDAGPAEEPVQSTPVALGLGFVALLASLAGVLLIIDLGPSSRSDQGVQVVLGGMSFAAAVLIGALPIIVYAVLLLAAAPLCGAAVHFRTGWEALLLQAYFTGSGSYLPLSTDAEISGPAPARARLALVSLGGLLALHLVFLACAHYFGSYPLQYAAGMFLLYCFVFSFPIAPLDGYYLWAYSRWLWVGVAIPVLASFIFLMPESLHVIL